MSSPKPLPKEGNQEEVVAIDAKSHKDALQSIPVLYDALKPVEKFCNTDLDLIQVKHIQPSKFETAAIIIISGPEQVKFLYNFSLYDVEFVDSEELCGSIEKVWPAGLDRVVILISGTLYIITVHFDQEENKVNATSSVLLHLPERLLDFDLTFQPESGLTLAGFQKPLKKDGQTSVAMVFPPPVKQNELVVYDPARGWIVVSKVISTLADTIRISADGSKCAWVVRLNHIPEEAERGEVYCCGLKNETVRTAHVRQLTSGAGRVGELALSPDGSSALYLANFSIQRPITTHMRLWCQATDGESPRKEVGARADGAAVWRFGLLIDGTGRQSNSVYTSSVAGADVHSALFPIDAPEQSQPLDLPVTRANLAVLVDNSHCYTTESAQGYPSLICGPDGIDLPHPPVFNALQTERIDCVSKDGTKIVAYLYQHRDAPSNAPLMVNVHGGPAGHFPHFRSDAAGFTRYPFRYLLFAGYKVLLPLFRGTLGFGDEFSSANILQQGCADLDDVIASIEAVKKDGGVDEAAHVGIFGGSYGGYMTMRALSRYPQLFKVGVAEYGFLAMRLMSLEGGDLTYELEYIGDIEWPLTEEAQVSDVINELHKIKAPTLFLHGEKDDICPLSQSMIAYRTLQSVSVPTGLVVYPDEYHGFKQKKHLEDRLRRILLWLDVFLPAKALPSDDEEQQQQQQE